MDGSSLRALLRRRWVSSPRSIADPLGLAFELLKPDSVNQVLRSLDRASLESLRLLADPSSADDAHNGDSTLAYAAALEELAALGLIGADESGRAVALPEVTAALGELISARAGEGGSREGGSGGDESGTGGVEDPGGVEPVTPAPTDGWFGPALTAVNRAAGIVRALRQRPVRLSKRGTLTVTARRELAEVAHDLPEFISPLITVMRWAHLVGTVDAQIGAQHLAVTRNAQAWLAEPATERWLSLAEAAMTQMPGPLHRILTGGISLHAGSTLSDPPPLHSAVDPLIDREFPLLAESDRAAMTAWVSAAEVLGLSLDGRLTPPARALLRADRAAARDCTSRDFPANAPGIYVQPDLSVIVPGPLAPDDEAGLTAIAVTEQLGVALTLRLSQKSLTRAVHDGESIDSIRERLTRLSLTGIPQPLDYQLSDLARKLAVGQLAAHPERPAITAETRETAAAPGPGADHAAQDRAAQDDTEFEALARRIEEAANAGGGDLARRLELAIRHRSPMRITAATGQSDPSERSFTLIPISLSSGRLRATDPAAGVERTLPLDAILRVEGAPPRE